MTPLGWMMIVISAFVGAVIGAYLSKRKPNLFSGRDKKMEKVLKDPHLLVEKLKAGGEIYDGGKKLDIKVGQDAETGKDVVVVEEIESKKAKTLQKKITKDKTKKKKKVKKGVKK